MVALHPMPSSTHYHSDFWQAFCLQAWIPSCCRSSWSPFEVLLFFVSLWFIFTPSYLVLGMPLIWVCRCTIFSIDLLWPAQGNLFFFYLSQVFIQLAHLVGECPSSSFIFYSSIYFSKDVPFSSTQHVFIGFVNAHVRFFVFLHIVAEIIPVKNDCGFPYLVSKWNIVYIINLTF